MSASYLPPLDPSSIHIRDAGRALLLVVSGHADLGEACGQVTAFLGFCRRCLRDPFGGGVLLGAWVDGGTLCRLPERLDVQAADGRIAMLTLREAFSLSDQWSLVVMDVGQAGSPPAVLSHGMVLEALLGSGDGGRTRPARYAPAFTPDIPEAQIDHEIGRLAVRYPWCITQPLHYDPVTGEVSCNDAEGAPGS